MLDRFAFSEFTEECYVLAFKVILIIFQSFAVKFLRDYRSGLLCPSVYTWNTLPQDITALYTYIFDSPISPC